MIRGFLFDLDGTLVDTHKANYEAYKRALADFGLDLTWERFKPSIGHQAKAFLPKLAPGLTEEQYAEIRERKAKYYLELMHHQLKDTFHKVITAGDVVHAKPDPEAYVLALKQLGLEPSEALAFEDSESGKQAAEAAGIQVIMIRDFAV
jgi:beta-phosphoglucomutase-like phosphatase (HAD superfamily)